MVVKVQPMIDSFVDDYAVGELTKKFVVGRAPSYRGPIGFCLRFCLTEYKISVLLHGLRHFCLQQPNYSIERRMFFDCKIQCKILRGRI